MEAPLSDRGIAVFLYMTFINYLQKMLSNEVRQQMKMFLYLASVCTTTELPSEEKLLTGTNIDIISP